MAGSNCSNTALFQRKNKAKRKEEEEEVSLQSEIENDGVTPANKGF